LTKPNSIIKKCWVSLSFNPTYDGTKALPWKLILTNLPQTMKYEWDQDKSDANLEKHGLSFEDAPLVFGGKCVTFEDSRFVYGEIRYITLGKLKGRVVLIVHTPRSNKTRIISMRKANNREQKIYQKRLEEN
jgi:uncharacterized DUF497 family protein